MREPPKNICPLRAIAGIGTSSGPAMCLEDGCAWFCIEYHQDGDYADGKCALVRIADALADKKTAPSATDAESGKETPQDP